MRDFLPPVFWRTLTGCCMVFGQAIDMDGRRLLPGPTSVISHNSIRIGCLSSKWTENRGKPERYAERGTYVFAVMT